MLKTMQLGKAGRIGIGWAAIVGIGIYAFVLSKNSIDKQRYEGMKIRQRMRNSNFGEYEHSDRRFDA